MTNREVLIQALQNFESEYDEDYVTDYINCPYVNNEDCLNQQRGIDRYGVGGWHDNCSECKRKWLFKEWEE